MELIDRRKLVSDFWQGVEDGAILSYEDTDNLIENAPTVDAVEVVHGWWEDFCRGKMCCCSVCKAEFDNTCNDIHGEWHYCPNCGAKMDGDGNENP